MKHYPITDEEGNLCAVAPENTDIRAESDRMIAEFKTKEEYAAIYKSAYNLWLDKNCCEAFYRARSAAKALPFDKGWNPPQEITLLIPLLTENRIPYTGVPPYKTNCRYNEDK